MPAALRHLGTRVMVAANSGSAADLEWLSDWRLKAALSSKQEFQVSSYWSSRFQAYLKVGLRTPVFYLKGV